jgi:hypothetical protein
MKDLDFTEPQISALLLRDIVKRHVNRDVSEADADCKCGQCQNEIKKKAKIFAIKMIDNKVLKLCSDDCLKQHEIVEMAMVGCSNLEQIPVIPRDMKLDKSSLRCEYYDRVLATQADYFDKTMKFREEFHNLDEPME